MLNTFKVLLWADQSTVYCMVVEMCLLFAGLRHTGPIRHNKTANTDRTDVCLNNGLRPHSIEHARINQNIHLTKFQCNLCAS